MNTIIALKGLVELLSTTAGISERQAEEFVRAFTATVTEGLKAGEMVRVKGVGVFSINSETRKINFVPDTELAEDANAPFNFFEEVELNPGVTEDMLAAVESKTVESHQEKEAPESEEPVTETAMQVPESATTESESEEQLPESTTHVPESEVTMAAPEVQEEPMTFVEEMASEPENEMVETVAEPEFAEPATVESEPKAVESEAEETEEPTNDVEVPEDAQEPDVEESESEPEEESEVQTIDYDSLNDRPAVWWLIWAAVIGLLVGFAIGYFVHDPIQECFEPALSSDYEDLDFYELDEPTEAANTLVSPDVMSDEADAETSTSATDAVEENKTPSKDETAAKTPAPKQSSSESTNSAAAVASQSAQPVYDEIRQNYFLTHMAYKHYGVKDYWVYIYLENQDKIQNPNRISIGTKLLIPPIEKYATQATQEERIAVARKKAGEIQAKFK